VRILNPQKNLFDKKHQNIWSNKIYTISGFDGIGYLLDNGKRKYMRRELLPVDKNTDNIENKITFKELSKGNKTNNKINKLNKLLK